MKKLSVFLVIFIALLFNSCRKCVNTYEATDPRISSCFFKVGSYFIYNDTTDHIIDSQYVFKDTFLPNFISFGTNGDCSNYSNEYNMWQTSYKNGLFYDSINTYSQDPGSLLFYETEGGISGWYYPSHDTSIFDNFLVSGNVYTTVYEVPSMQQYFNDSLITDFYFAQGYGVVKKVEHRTTGNVSWDLIRYHIVQ